LVRSGTPPDAVATLAALVEPGNPIRFWYTSDAGGCSR
jgi:hypothetical protein